MSFHIYKLLESLILSKSTNSIT